jgi:RecB family endonuclease NucS
MFKTEDHLRDKLITEINQYIDDEIIDIIKEYKVDHGAIDLYIKGKDNKHVIEVKRHKISINSCMQLKKYLECLTDSLGYVAAPGITKSALKYCEENNINYIEIDF